MDKIEEIDLSFLIGPEITQIRIGAHHVQLNFIGDISICIEADFTNIAENPTQDCRSFVDKGASLVSVIGASITKVCGNSGGTLTMVFSSGDRVVVSLEETGYESLEIWNKDDYFIL